MPRTCFKALFLTQYGGATKYIILLYLHLCAYAVPHARVDKKFLFLYNQIKCMAWFCICNFCITEGHGSVVYGCTVC